jgi:predicted dehydrogenase
MNSTSLTDPSRTTRREFLKTSGTALAGAAQAMSTQGPTKLWAMADVFEDRLQSSLANLKQGHEKQLEVPPERQFIGLDGYKKAIDSLDKGDVVLLTTPPGFRPIHLEYAVQKGVNVFMEKSFAVDGPGVRRVLKAGEDAKQKNLKVAGGLMSRHYKPLEEAIQHVHDGMIGELITVWAYRMHGPVGLNPRQPGMKEIAYQISNYSCFTWLNGTFLEDWLVHNIDVCCWAKNAWPASVQGMGGRQVRKDADQLFDHYSAEYTFPDGTRFVGEGRHIASCFDFWGAVLQGAKGSAIMGEGQDDPRLFKGWNQTSENLIWRYKGPKCDKYQYEHDLLFDAIRNDKPYNEAERCAKTSLTCIMGRMACESGKKVTWEEALASNIELAPGLENCTWDGNAPVMPDANGQYPIAMPGQTPGA